jgi:glycosyltransferase involved in cell wall biosynthesis
MKLSILTPAIWSRQQQAITLKNEIEDQVNAYMLDHPALTAPPIEHLVLLDTRTRSVGLKRQALLDSALGDYIAFVDDDDTISADYAEALLTAIDSSPDVVTFHQTATVDGKTGTIRFDAAAKHDDPWLEGGTVTRPPWHVCAWRRDLVCSCIFPDKNYGEDLEWCLQARPLLRSAVHVPRVLHHYRHDAALTAAPRPL